MTVTAILHAARSELGYTEQPHGSNLTKFAKEAGHANGHPWCATFVVAMARRANVVLPNESAYTPTMAQGFKFQNRWHGRNYGKPGDIVFYDFPGGQNRIEHVGIVESLTGGFVTAIEGNTSSGNDTNGGAVQRRTRQLSYVVGFGRPDYQEGKLQVLYKCGASGQFPQDIGKTFVTDLLFRRLVDDDVEKGTLVALLGPVRVDFVPGQLHDSLRTI